MEIPTVIAFCWSLPICKKSDLLFWITLNTSDHFHLKWLKVLLLLLPYLTTCKKLSSYLKFFVRYCGLKNPAFWGFWIITQEPDFCKHVVLAKSTKKNIGTSCWSKKAYLNGQDFCERPKNLTLGTVKPSKPSPRNLFGKIGIHHFSYFIMWNFMEKKRKKLVIQRSCIPGKWEKERSQINRTLLLRQVLNLFFHHRDNIDFSLQYGRTFL